jgi:hypothetical protein
MHSFDNRKPLQVVPEAPVMKTEDSMFYLTNKSPILFENTLKTRLLSARKKSFNITPI